MNSAEWFTIKTKPMQTSRVIILKMLSRYERVEKKELEFPGKCGR